MRKLQKKLRSGRRSQWKKKSIFRSLYDWFTRKSRDEAEENEESDDWGEFEGVGDFEDILADAEEDGIRHLNTRDPGKYSHCNGAEDCGDAWHVYDHRTEGGSISRKKTDISFGENRMVIRPTGIRKETEHLKGPFMAFLRRKTLSIRMRR